VTAPVAELQRVSLALRGIPVLDDVSLRIEPGDYLAILGPNGGGKTTLLKVLLGLRPPDRGTVRVFGSSPKHAVGRVGYVPQVRTFDPDFPIRVLDVVLMGRLRRGSLGRLRAEDRERAHDALVRVEMWDLAERPIGALSGGQLQRVLIARALVGEPQLLLLDEPTSSLDERMGRGIWDFFEELSRSMAVVVVSHDIGAISRHVRSVACLNRRLYAHPSKALTPEVMEAAYGCPIDLVAHGHPHRVLPEHPGGAS
jgi:zinc transport system ATP-binding protein